MAALGGERPLDATRNTSAKQVVSGSAQSPHPRRLAV